MRCSLFRFSLLFSFLLFSFLVALGIHHTDGRIRGCIEDIIDDVPVADELRRLLFDPDSDNYSVYNDRDRQELIFRIFKHVALGGGLCQYEENIQPYLQATKLLYKDLVQVRKQDNSNQLVVVSKSFQIQSLETKKNKAADEASSLFASSNRFHTCVLSIEPMRRHVYIYYCPFKAAW